MSARSFVIVGQTALASDAFLLNDFPGTSGRLDVLARCVRAALLVSHGVRRDAAVYLVLLGGPRAPRTVRIAGADVKFLRPDERSIATLLQKVLTGDHGAAGDGFVPVKPGIAVAAGGLDAVLADLSTESLYVLDETGSDARGHLRSAGGAFFLGDHVGFNPDARAQLLSLGARTVSVGPVSLHTDDVVSVVSNELDRIA